MNEIEIIKWIFGLMLSVGAIVLFILAYTLSYKYLIQENRCTAKVKGIIKRYTFASRGNGFFLPVVHYWVNSREYKVTGPEYTLYKTVTVRNSSPEDETELDAESQVLTVRKTVHSSFAAYRNPINILYPLSSEIDVYYDPDNPKLAYVLRYCNKKWTFYAMFFSAVFLLVVDLFILFGL